MTSCPFCESGSIVFTDEKNALFSLVDEAKHQLDEKHRPDGYNMSGNAVGSGA